MSAEAKWRDSSKKQTEITNRPKSSQHKKIIIYLKARARLESNEKRFRQMEARFPNHVLFFQRTNRFHRIRKKQERVKRCWHICSETKSRFCAKVTLGVDFTGSGCGTAVENTPWQKKLSRSWVRILPDIGLYSLLSFSCMYSYCKVKKYQAVLLGRKNLNEHRLDFEHWEFLGLRPVEQFSSLGMVDKQERASFNWKIAHRSKESDTS